MKWNKKRNETINGGKENDYEKDYMKIKFNSDDNLPLNKSLKFHLMTVTITSVFAEDSKLYPQVFLDYTLWVKLIKKLEYERMWYLPLLVF